MGKRINLIDVATTSTGHDYTKKVKVSQLLADCGIDLVATKSKDVVLRVGRDRVGLDDFVEPGATVLLTRNIDGG
jgi:hypothetical protein